MLEGEVFHQNHKSNEAGTAIVVSVSKPATIFVALEDGGRDGGFSSSLPLAVWSKMQGAVLSTTCGDLSRIFRLATDAGPTALPLTTTGSVVMTIVVVDHT